MSRELASADCPVERSGEDADAVDKPAKQNGTKPDARRKP